MGVGPGPGPGGPKSKPVDGPITSPYGMRKDPHTGKQKMHKGVDFGVPVGTAVKATSGGTVVRAGWENPNNPKQGWGRVVFVDHGNGRTSVYAHLDSISVKPGDKIEKGHVVGNSGNSGSSTAPHLHYEERQNGNPQSPKFTPDELKP